MDELFKNVVKLKPKDNVPFKCTGCGECCKHVQDLVPIETLDAFRIARYLMQQNESIACMDDFWERYADAVLLMSVDILCTSLKPRDRMTRASSLRTTAARFTRSIQEPVELIRLLQVL